MGQFKIKRRNLSKMKTNPTALYVYADELGNTGPKLFDGNQPYFWTELLFRAC